MRHSALACLGALASLALAPVATADEAQPETPVSIHQLEALQHAGETYAPRIVPAQVPLRTNAPSRVVYGYYPYWVADLTTIRWNALTHLAWFSIDLDRDGAIVARHGWPDPDVVSTAHAAGVRVDLTFTLFGGADIENLCNSPSRRASTISTIVTEMEAGNADGVSIDFEFVNGDTRAGFVAFIQELRAALDIAGHPDAEISIAGPTVDWGDGLDMPALLDAADWFFIMGYGYFWSGSSHAGPTGMMRVTPDWASVQTRSMLRTLATYSTRLTAEQRHQLIWGVPYYGREYVTVSGERGASVIDQNGAVTYSAAVEDLQGAVEPLYDDGIENPWYRWQSGNEWHQVYYDDARSLAAKYDLAFAQDLGGVGMWALNYDKPHAELWDLLEDTLHGSEPLAEGHRFSPIRIGSFPFQDERDTREGPSHYFNHYSCDPLVPEYGREWVYQVDVCQPGTLVASVPVYDDRDPDLHLLSEPDQEACLARGHTELETEVEAGSYLLTVDTFVDTPIEMAGPYTLDVDFFPQAGTEGCADYLSCHGGSCVCEEPSLTDCGQCVDLDVDPNHCGACGQVCAAGEQCVSSACENAAGVGGGGGMPPGATPLEDDAGCSCRAAGHQDQPSRAWALALLAAAVLERRRRR